MPWINEDISFQVTSFKFLWLLLSLRGLTQSSVNTLNSRLLLLFSTDRQADILTRSSVRFKFDLRLELSQLNTSPVSTLILFFYDTARIDCNNVESKAEINDSHC